MKDQFANYVVQKALDVCSDQQMKCIVSRCVASLNVLKKYTYGKHIVSRVEKLIATGGTNYSLRLRFWILRRICIHCFTCLIILFIITFFYFFTQSTFSIIIIFIFDFLLV